jgi:hypothetical protein
MNLIDEWVSEVVKPPEKNEDNTWSTTVILSNDGGDFEKTITGTEANVKRYTVGYTYLT